MGINEIVAESIVNKLSALLKKKVAVASPVGDILASSDLAETGKNYEQLRQAADGSQEIETMGPASKTTLSQGIIVPIFYGGENRNNNTLGQSSFTGRSQDRQST